MIHARVFPLLHKEFILGLPWLRSENPDIDWTLGRVTVYRAGRAVLLPVVARTAPGLELSSLNLLSAKHVQRLVRKGKLQHAFLRFVRQVEDKEGLVHDEGTGGAEVNKLFQKDMPKCIQKVLKDYSDVFPVDLPPGLPPSDKGMNSRLI